MKKGSGGSLRGLLCFDDAVDSTFLNVNDGSLQLIACDEFHMVFLLSPVFQGSFLWTWIYTSLETMMAQHDRVNNMKGGWKDQSLLRAISTRRSSDRALLTAAAT